MSAQEKESQAQKLSELQIEVNLSESEYKKLERHAEGLDPDSVSQLLSQSPAVQEALLSDPRVVKLREDVLAFRPAIRRYYKPDLFKGSSTTFYRVRVSDLFEERASNRNGVPESVLNGYGA